MEQNITEENLTCNALTRLRVHVGFHPGYAVVRHLLGQVAVELLLGHVVPLLGGDGPEGVLNLLAGLDVLRLLADHEGHVLLQGDEAISVGIHHVEDGLKLRLRLPVLHHGEVVAKSSEAGLEGVVVQLASLVLVEVTEHHGELLQGVLCYSALVPGLDLLLQVVPDPHAQLVELVPLLSQPHRAVLGVAVVQDQLLLQDGSEVLNLAEVGGTSSYLMSLKIE